MGWELKKRTQNSDGSFTVTYENSKTGEIQKQIIKDGKGLYNLDETGKKLPYKYLYWSDELEEHEKKAKQFKQDSLNLDAAIKTHKAMSEKFAGYSPMWVIGEQGDKWQAAIDSINAITSRMWRNNTWKAFMGESPKELPDTDE